MSGNSSDLDALLERLRAGDTEALGPLFARFRERLRRKIAWHLARDPRLAGRFDASDVVQEALGDAQRQLTAYLADPGPLAFAAWLERLTWQRWRKFQREHLDAQCRTVKRQRRLPDDSGQHPAAAGGSGDAVRWEQTEQIRQALRLLKREDREVIRLRVYEGRSNPEAGALLRLAPEAVAKRLERALRRLRAAHARAADGGAGA